MVSPSMMMTLWCIWPLLPSRRTSRPALRRFSYSPPWLLAACSSSITICTITPWRALSSTAAASSLEVKEKAMLVMLVSAALTSAPGDRGRCHPARSKTQAARRPQRAAGWGCWPGCRHQTGHSKTFLQIQWCNSPPGGRSGYGPGRYGPRRGRCRCS